MQFHGADQMSPRMRWFFTRIFPLPFILVGAILGLVGFRGLARARESVHWPSVQGIVRDSTVDRRRSSSSNGSSTTYHAVISYEYTTDGVTHFGSRVAYGDYGSSNPSHARGVVSRYPQGSAVTVYYMPDKPTESLLEPGVQAQSWFLPAFGVLFFVVGNAMALILPKAISAQRATESAA